MNVLHQIFTPSLSLRVPFISFVCTGYWVAYMPKIDPQSRLLFGAMIGKLFGPLCSLPSLITPKGFSLISSDY
jgi:hypothetical protein